MNHKLWIISYDSYDMGTYKNLITDPLYSIALSSKSVPMVSVKQTKTQVDFQIMVLKLWFYKTPFDELI